MIVSPTEIGTYKRCRRQWLVNSRNRWSMTRIVPPNALALGTLIHDTLGLWLVMHKNNEALPASGLPGLFVAHANDAINTANATYERQVGAIMSDSELAPLYESVLQGQCMMTNYQARWRQPIPAGFEIVATEMRAQVEIPGTEHTSEYVWEAVAADDGAEGAAHYTPGLGWAVKHTYNDVRLHRLEGRLDGVLRELRSGRLYVLEHKTYGQRPREEVLFSNAQFLTYHWMLLQLVESMGFSRTDVAGVAYDGLWKRASPPKVVDGHKGTLQDLFCRRLITRPVQEMIEFEDLLRLEVTEMANNPPIYHNRTADGSCFWGCNDNQLCLAMSRGEDYAYMLRSQYTRKAEEDVYANEQVDAV